LYVAVDYGYKGNGAVLAFEEDGILKILDEYACRLFILTSILLTEFILGDQSLVAAP
jgi:hypothetical protein